MKSIVNAMSVDVEDYFQVSAFENVIRREQWDQLPCRVEQNTQRLLDLFAEFDVKITFFTLGWVAERYPSLIQRMVKEGHELACHGYEHIRVTQQTPQQFAADIRKSKQLLEDLGGVEVIGYRAASYSIGAQNLWALEELQEAGFKYSSSIYPVKHDLYGMPDAPRFKFIPDNAPRLTEIPITTSPWLGKTWPAGGGGFFRFFPYPFSKQLIQRVNQQDQQPAIFYFHPWEIDPQQPRQQASWKSRFRHYLNLHRMEPRLRQLLRDFEWGRMDQIFLNQTQPTITKVS